jgi:hypothetical protein
VGLTNTGTGTYSVSNAGSSIPARLEYTGLALGLHKVRVTHTSGGTFGMQAIDVITPIHTHKSNLYGVIQNTLPVGSTSLLDTRATSYAQTQKAWAQAVGVSSSPTYAGAANPPTPNMSVAIKTSGGPLHIVLSGAFGTSGGTSVLWIAVDGFVVGPDGMDEITMTTDEVVSLQRIVPVSAGFHNVQIHWRNSSGTITAIGLRRTLTVREL